MILEFAFKNTLKYRKRSLVVFIAVTASLFVFVISMGLINGLRKMFNRMAFENTGHILVYKEGYYKRAEMLPIDLTIDNADKISQLLKSNPEIVDITSELRIGGMVISGEKSFDMIVRGIDLDKTNQCSRYRRSLKDGVFPQNSSQILIGKPVAEMLNVHIGDTVVLMAYNVYGGVNAIEQQVSGLFETEIKDENENFVFVGIDKCRDLIQHKNGVTEIAVTIRDPALVSSMIHKLDTIVKENSLEALSWKDVYKEIFVEMSLFNFLSTILFIIIIVVVSIGIINTMLISVFERIKDIGTLRAIGTSKGQMARLLLTESAILGISGSVLGITLGSMAVMFLSKKGILLGEAWEQFAGIRILYPYINMQMCLLALILGIGISIFGAVYPMLVAINMKPIKAIFHR